MFKIKEIVKTSGKGRAAGWDSITGVVTQVLENSLIVQWNRCAVQDGMPFNELVSSGEFAEAVPHVCRELHAGENGLTAGKLFTTNDEKP